MKTDPFANPLLVNPLLTTGFKNDLHHSLEDCDCVDVNADDPAGHNNQAHTRPMQGITDEA